MTKTRPTKHENNTADCRCESCGVDLDKRKFVWYFREHLGCSKACVLACEAEYEREDRDLECINESVFDDNAP